MNYEKIGIFISTLRKEKGLTQKDLASLIHVTDRAVSKWERGKGCPDISLLEDLSKTLDVSIIELLKGEKIQKKEKIENKELLYSINYAEISMKEKINNTINIIVVTLIILISMLLLFHNIKISVFFNQKYYPNIYYSDSKNLVDMIENKINIIKNNQGNYTEEEYKTLLSFVDNINMKDEELFNRRYYTYQDMKNIIDSDYGNDMNYFLYSPIYNILSKYNIHKNIDIDYYIDAFHQNKNKIKEFINNCYKYNYVYEIDENIGNNMKNLIYNKYYMYSLILTDIIGGDINE